MELLSIYLLIFQITYNIIFDLEMFETCIYVIQFPDIINDIGGFRMQPRSFQKSFRLLLKLWFH